MSSYLWVLSLEIANLGAHTQFTFLKYPCLGPPSTPSGNFPAKSTVYTPYIYIYMCVSGQPYICAIASVGESHMYMYTVYERMYDNFPADCTV
jgi:hypothetical protein